MKTPSLEYCQQNVYKLVPRVLRTYWPEFYKHITSRWPELRCSEQVYRYFYGEPVRCVCGKPTKYINFTKGYTQYCSCKCAANSNQKDRERTCLERYGHISALCTEESKTKAKSKTKLAAATRKKTCLERYGVEYASQTNIAKESYRRTCLERYGVTNTFISHKEQIRKTCLERYGVENASQDESVKKKIAERSSLTQRRNFIDSHDFLLDYTESGDWICRCPHPDCDCCKDKTYIISALNYNQRMANGSEPCTRLFPIGTTQTSTMEITIQRLLDDHGIEYIKHDRKMLGGHELDFYIPSHNLAIECNGCYWHSDARRARNYHIKKWEQCLTKGIMLVTIWEDWMLLHPQIVESIILSKLGIYKRRIGARKCKVVELKSVGKFLDENHIQGNCRSTVKLALVNAGEIVAVMCFAKRSKLSGSKNVDPNEWELIRFCSLLSTQVMGGASKLLKYAISHIKPAKIVSFSSNDISTGELYKSLKFAKKSMCTPYWYIDAKTYQRHHRSNFTRTAIVRRWPEYNIDDKSWTEKSVMDLKHYYRIYDSGMQKWELIIK